MTPNVSTRLWRRYRQQLYLPRRDPVPAGADQSTATWESHLTAINLCRRWLHASNQRPDDVEVDIYGGIRTGIPASLSLELGLCPLPHHDNSGMSAGELYAKGSFAVTEQLLVPRMSYWNSGTPQ